MTTTTPPSTPVKITPAQRRVLRYLEIRQGENGSCWPSQKRIAADLRVSRKTVQRALKTLENLREIAVDHHHGGPWNQNHYTVLPAVQNVPPNPRSEPESTVGGTFSHECPTEPPSEATKAGLSHECPTDVPPMSHECPTTDLKVLKCKVENNKSASLASSLAKARSPKNTDTEKANFDLTVRALAERHIALSPAAKREHLEQLLPKIADAVKEYDEPDEPSVATAIRHYSPRGSRGDGWGIVLRALREGWTADKERDDAYDDNVARDVETLKALPAQPPEPAPTEKQNQTDAERQEEEEAIVWLAETHIEQSPAARTEHLAQVTSKVTKAVRQYGCDRVTGAIAYFSHKGGKGDGFGIVLRALHEEWVDAKEREILYQLKLEREEDQKRKLPPRPPWLQDMCMKTADNMQTKNMARAAMNHHGTDVDRDTVAAEYESGKAYAKRQEEEELKASDRKQQQIATTQIAALKGENKPAFLTKQERTTPPLNKKQTEAERTRQVAAVRGLDVTAPELDELEPTPTPTPTPSDIYEAVA